MSCGKKETDLPRRCKDDLHIAAINSMVTLTSPSFARGSHRAVMSRTGLDWIRDLLITSGVSYRWEQREKRCIFGESLVLYPSAPYQHSNSQCIVAVTFRLTYASSSVMSFLYGHLQPSFLKVNRRCNTAHTSTYHSDCLGIQHKLRSGHEGSKTPNGLSTPTALRCLAGDDAWYTSPLSTNTEMAKQAGKPEIHDITIPDLKRLYISESS